jgi:hypothetical protein
MRLAWLLASVQALGIRFQIALARGLLDDRSSVLPGRAALLVGPRLGTPAMPDRRPPPRPRRAHPRFDWWADKWLAEPKLGEIE